MFSPILKALTLAILLLSVSSARAAWRFSSPRPHGNNILDMNMQGEVVWQIGERGQIYTTTDLDTWLPHNSGTTRSLRSIAFFNGKSYISTEEGGILIGVSPDQYSFKNLGTTDWLEGIAASPTGIVAVGDNGAIYSSPDGENWTRQGNFTTWLRSVAYGGNLFVTVGENGFIATSPDGQSWQERTVKDAGHLNKVAFINNGFWIAGENGLVLTNNFRMTFNSLKLNTTNTFFTVSGNSNEVVVAGDSTVYLGNLRSGSWAEQADPASPELAPLWPYYSSLWDGRLFLLGGRTGMKVEGFRTNDAASMRWYADPQPTRNWLWSATYVTNLYAACGAQGTIVTSEDGVDWAREVTPSKSHNEVLLGIGGNSNALIAVGSGGVVLRAPNVVTNSVYTNELGQAVPIEVSLFGTIWEESVSPGTADLQAVAASDDLYLIGGSGGSLFTSADGQNWQARVSGVTNFISSATTSPQGWIASGAGGLILGSSDAIAWSRRTSGVSDWVYSVRFLGGKLLAVGENGLILTSEDGVVWTKRVSGTTEWLNDVTFAQNTWYIAASGGLILTSTDSVSWSVIPSISSRSLYAAVTDGNQLIMAGLEGVILRNRLFPAATPVDIASYARVAPDDLFLFAGEVDQRFQLEEKSRLEDPWAPTAILEIGDTDGFLFYEQPGGSERSRFFRTRLLQP